MTPYELICSCGHKAVIPLYGPDVARYHKVTWFETKGLCPSCYAIAHPPKTPDKYEEIRMHYGQYKTSYPDCEVKQGSYDYADKTIVVYVPK